ncbi:hypothetical protein M1P97_14315 [Parabacteroides sp. GYB001]|uniref:hypothetical protein n=1 Tax=Parabacteroides leei TaxID=2939491 RepID=UPI002016D6C6|nr:hypothetical protein [Parabacteroides leei]MCL3852462.1 hypothetical protein [Parabacteroides leei]
MYTVNNIPCIFINATPTFLRLRFANLAQVSAILQAGSVTITNPAGAPLGPFTRWHSEGLEIIFK